jgi:hypothetical protein
LPHSSSDHNDTVPCTLLPSPHVALPAARCTLMYCLLCRAVPPARQISVLREYLALEMRPQQALPFAYDPERIYDDFVFMCFFVGGCCCADSTLA